MRGAGVLQKIPAAAAALAGSLLRPLPQLVLLVLLVVVGWRAGTWLWRLWPPPAPVAMPVERGERLASALGRHWFGIAPAGTSVAAGEATAAAMPSAAVKLLGVIAGGPRPAALLRLDNANFEALLGEEFADGWRLQAIESDAVVLVHDGREMRIVMAAPTATASAAPPARETMRKATP